MRSRLTGLALGIAAFSLASCENGEAPNHAERAYDMSQTAMHAISEAPAPPAALMGFAEDRARAEAQPVSLQSVEQYIAYTHFYGLSFGPGGAELAMDSHRQRCLDAGPQICQVMQANASQEHSQYFRASLQMRAVPGWISEFRDGLQGETEAGGGRIINQVSTATDLTSPILDTEARLSAKRQLRERLTALLSHEEASVEELVQLERELARVQGEIESAEAQLQAMRVRVTMSMLNLNYSTQRPTVSSGAFDPVGRAVGNSVRDFSRALGQVITFLVSVLPWMIVIIPVGWLGLRGVRAMFRRRANKT